MKILLILSFVVYATASICCPPFEQYECRMNVRGGIYYPAYKFAELQDTNMSLHADITNKKVAFEETIRSGGGTVTHLKSITDFNQGVQYMIIDGTTCTKFPIETTLEDIACIPDDAELLGTYDYAMGKLKGSEYKYTVKQLGQIQTYVMTVTNQCIPLALQVVGGDEAGTFQYTTGGTYVNITPGIKDPSIFDVPSICSHKAAVSPLKSGQMKFNNVVEMNLDN
ncbi:ependymin-related protein 1-like [Glandiceps talaboti]